MTFVATETSASAPRKAHRPTSVAKNKDRHHGWRKRGKMQARRCRHQPEEGRAVKDCILDDMLAFANMILTMRR